MVQSYDPDMLLTGIGPAWSLVIEVVFCPHYPGRPTLAAVLVT